MFEDSDQVVAGSVLEALVWNASQSRQLVVLEALKDALDSGAIEFQPRGRVDAELTHVLVDRLEVRGVRFVQRRVNKHRWPPRVKYLGQLELTLASLAGLGAQRLSKLVFVPLAVQKAHERCFTVPDNMSLFAPEGALSRLVESEKEGCVLAALGRVVNHLTEALFQLKSACDFSAPPRVTFREASPLGLGAEI